MRWHTRYYPVRPLAPLIAECFDPIFLRAVGVNGSWVHLCFLTLVVLNLVGGFHALGTLMAVGLMMLPATAARFWATQVGSLAAVAAALAVISGFGGLLLSYHCNLPSGPAIVLLTGALYVLSILCGRHDSVLTMHFARGAHREA